MRVKSEDLIDRVYHKILAKAIEKEPYLETYLHLTPKELAELEKEIRKYRS